MKTEQFNGNDMLPFTSNKLFSQQHETALFLQNNSHIQLNYTKHRFTHFSGLTVSKCSCYRAPTMGSKCHKAEYL